MSILILMVTLPLAGAQLEPNLMLPLESGLALSDDQNAQGSAPPAEKVDEQSDEDMLPLGTADQPAPIEGAAPDDAIVVTARSTSAAGDPLQAVNVVSFEVVQSVDKAVARPVALTYKKSVPAPIRSGLRNFMTNLQEPIVFLNYLLQLKPGKSAETLGRFAINSTIGAAGLFDIAKRRPFKLPFRANGFGNTLGYYGVKPGPYIYLPFIGPTTIRDFGGRLVDLSVLPVAVGKPFNVPAFTIPTTVIRLVDERAEADATIREQLDSATDPYTTIKENYLTRRQAEIDSLREKDEADVESPNPATPGDGASTQH